MRVEPQAGLDAAAVRREAFAVADDGAGSEMPQDGSDLRVRQGRVDRREDRAQVRQRKPDVEDLGAVRQHHDDAVAGADAALGERRRQAMDAPLELAVADHALAVVHQEGTVSPARHRAGQQLAERRARGRFL